MLINAEVIIHKFQGKSFRIIENRALNINTNSLIFVFIETTTIAIKDKGITSLKEMGIQNYDNIEKIIIKNFLNIFP